MPTSIADARKQLTSNFEAKGAYFSNVPSLWLGVFVFLLYVITARIGLSIHSVNTFATLIWPAAGIALASTVLFGYRMLPAVALGALVANLMVGGTFYVALGIAFGNTLESFAGAYFLREVLGFDHGILRITDNVGIILVAFIATLLSATIGTATLWLAQVVVGIHALETTWLTWWIGDVLGVLIVAPVALKWISKPTYKRATFQYVEFALVIVAVVATSILLFWTPWIYRVYYLFLPLGWAALRTGPRGTTFSIFISAVIAISGTVAGYGAYAGEGLLPLQIFLATTATIFLMFAATVEERRRIQEALKRHVNELEHALKRVSSEDEAKNQFIAILAHELRNPLAAILSSVELLKIGNMPHAESTKLLATVDNRSRTMGQLLDDLLDVARISQKKLHLNKKPIILCLAVARAAETAQPLIRARGHTLTIALPEEVIPIEADPVRIEQICINLLSNAAKYTERGGNVTLTVERDGNMAAIRVRDTGIGISASMMRRIFEPFFQVAGAKRAEGLGIGLSLTRQLVELHGGTIEAKSQGEGRGSEFTVLLPLPETKPLLAVDRKTLQGKRALRPAKHALRILVVDDNAAALNALGKLLELRGHRVSLACNGVEAIAEAKRITHQVVILDIGLPDIDGYEVARRLRKEHPSVFLIALTGYGQQEDKEHAFRAGFDRHLTKPVGLKEIEAVLRKAYSEVREGSPHQGVLSLSVS